MNSNLSLGLGIVIIVLWGLWGFSAKIASQKIGMQVLVWSLMAQAIIAFAYLTVTKQLWPFQVTTASLWGLAVGASAALSSILFYTLMQRHPASLIVSLTALYPAVTVLLSVIFLKEPLSPTQIVGIILALVAGVLLTR